MAKILGISASLRNARKGSGNKILIDELKAINDEESLKEYLKNQAQIHLQQFVDAGRKEHLPFDEIYTNLKKNKGNVGLSNSEVALSAALWSANQLGSEIEHISLGEYFLESKKKKNEQELIEKINEADGILVSTPVYFGDRSSLSQSFINFIILNRDKLKNIEQKVYAGISVGAKRNGGQETTLIYQLYDFVNIGMLGVGNDSETTSQYGGTGYAGDIGSMGNDDYGLAMSMGTGRRLARVSTMISEYGDYTLVDKLKVQLWILQDKNGFATEKAIEAFSHLKGDVELSIINICNKEIIRCIACDICPTHIDVDRSYRCIIKSKTDDFEHLHEQLLEADVIVPVIYCSKDKSDLVSNYQRFIERTRYLRRGDYVFSDLVVLPFVIEEVGANDNMALRSMTSLMRHHTIIAKPTVLSSYKDEILEFDEAKKELSGQIKIFKKVIISRINLYANTDSNFKYNPVGYVLSAAKEAEDEKLDKRRGMLEKRNEKIDKMKTERLK